MKGIELIERKPTVEELFILRESVGWGTGEKEAFEKGLKNSLYGVCVFKDGKITGAARVIGDGSTCFYIQDVIVKPEHQKTGIGMQMMGKLMEYIEANACSGAVVGLMSAKGKEEFYEKFGFWKRPNEYLGHGMMQFWKKSLLEVRKI
jgi:predicted GNAT family N-acyltransferase